MSTKLMAPSGVPTSQTSGVASGPMRAAASSTRSSSRPQMATATPFGGQRRGRAEAEPRRRRRHRRPLAGQSQIHRRILPPRISRGSAARSRLRRVRRCHRFSRGRADQAADPRQFAGGVAWLDTHGLRSAPPRPGQRRALPVLVRRRRRARLQRDARARRVVRPVRRRRRLHGPLDGDPRQGARPGPRRRAARGRDDRLGRVGAQRRVHGVEPHPRRGERPGALPRTSWPSSSGSGSQTLDDIEAAIATYAIDCDFERTGVIDIATAPHQLDELREDHEQLAALGQDVELLDEAGMRAQVDSPTYRRRAVAQGPGRHRRPGPAGLGPEGGRRVARRADLRAHQGHRAASATASAMLVAHALRQGAGRAGGARHQRLPAAAAPDAALHRARLRLRDGDRAADARAARRRRLAQPPGLSDYANQFHYYRLTEDNRILWGGYDAVYYFGGKVNPDLEHRPETFARLSASTSSPPSRSSRASSSPTLWGGAIDTCTRFCVFWDTAMQGRVAYAAGYTGLGVCSTRFGAEVLVDLLDGRRTERTAAGVRAQEAAAVPARADQVPRHPAHPLVARPRRPPARPPQRLAAHPRPARSRLRQLTPLRRRASLGSCSLTLDRRAPTRRPAHCAGLRLYPGAMPTPPASVAEVAEALAEHQYLPDEGLATAIFLALRAPPPAAARGRGRRRQDRGGQGARPLDRRRADPPAVLRGHRRQPGRLRVGLLPPAAAPAGRRGRRRGHRRRAPTSWRTSSTPSASSCAARCCGPSTTARARRRCCSSTRSTGPTTSSRPSCSRSCPTTRSRCPSWARSAPPTPPVVIITSNRTRDVHDALKRRCLYHWVEHPDFDREVAIVRLRAPEVAETLARQVAAATEAFRGIGLYKPPGVAETIDWATSLAVLGQQHLDEATVAATLGTVLKYREDQERVRQHGLADLVRHAFERGAPMADARRTRARPSCAVAFARGCCAAAGLDRAGRRRCSRSPRPSARSGVADARRGLLGRAGPRSCSGPRTTASTTGPSPRSGRAPAWRPDDEPEPEPLTRHPRGRRRATTATGDDDAEPTGDDPTITAALQRPRGAAPQGLRRLQRRRARRGPPADGRPAPGRRPAAVAAPGPSHAPAGPPRPAPHGPPRPARRRRADARAVHLEPGERPRRLVLLCDISRLDGALRPGPAALRPRRRGRAGRGSRRSPSAPGSPGSPASCRAATPTSRCARPAAQRGRLVGRHPPGRRAAAPSTTSGACGAWPAGAVVVILSDGWDRGDPEVLAEQMARLAPGGPPGGVGEPAEGHARLRAAGPGNGGGPALRRRVRRGPLAGRPGAAWREVISAR